MTFISRSSVESDLAAGHARRGAGRGARAAARDLPRPRERARRDPGGAGVRRVRARAAARDRPLVARRAAGAARRSSGIARPFLIASPRWDRVVELPGRRAGGRRCPRSGSRSRPGADGLLAIGGGSAIDTAKAASAATDLPLVSRADDLLRSRVGVELRRPHARPADRRRRRRRAASPAIVYDVGLTLDLPRAGDRRNRAERARPLRRGALRRRRSERERRAAPSTGAELIARWLPRGRRRARTTARRGTGLLRGAAAAGEALGLAGLALAHAMAQALGGTYGLPHGAMNALTLPPALRFNAAVVPEAVARVRARRSAPRTIRPAAVEELARLGGFERLRDFGVPESELARGRRDGRGARRATGGTRGRRRRTRSRSCSARSTDTHS